MEKADKARIIEALAVSCEVMGNEISETALKVMAADLESYGADAIEQALTRCRREVSGRLSLAAIMERLVDSDGRPNEEEAWGMVPKNEYDSAFLTEEILKACDPAMSLYNDGDKVAARMSFKEKYSRLCDEARQRGEPVRWLPSFGHDKNGRGDCILKALEQGRITKERAMAFQGFDEIQAAIQRTPDAKQIGSFIPAVTRQ